MTKQEILLLTQLINWNIAVLQSRQNALGKSLTVEISELVEHLGYITQIWVVPESCTPEIEARLKGVQILARTYAEFQLLKQF